MNIITINSGIVRYFERLEDKRKNGVKSNVINSSYKRINGGEEFIGLIEYYNDKKEVCNIKITIENDAIGYGKSWCIVMTNSKGGRHTKVMSLQKELLSILKGID